MTSTRRPQTTSALQHRCVCTHTTERGKRRLDCNCSLSELPKLLISKLAFVFGFSFVVWGFVLGFFGGVGFFGVFCLFVLLCCAVFDTESHLVDLEVAM